MKPEYANSSAEIERMQVRFAGKGRTPATGRTIACRSTGFIIAGAVWGLLFLGTNFEAQATDGREIFDKNCAACHSKDGTAQTPAARKLGVKDLSLSKLTDAQIIQQVREGTLDPARKTKMPAYKDRLRPEEIESIVSVVKGFRK